jgi:hypothetical protein
MPQHVRSLACVDVCVAIVHVDRLADELPLAGTHL